MEMPVFAPNDYFWNKFWDGKDPETKWQVYADAVREAMAEVGGYELSDSTMDDKQDYVDLVWGSKVKRDWTISETIPSFGQLEDLATKVSFLQILLHILI